MSFKYIIILQQMYAILSNKRQRCYKKYNKKSANDCITFSFPHTKINEQNLVVAVIEYKNINRTIFNN